MGRCSKLALPQEAITRKVLPTPECHEVAICETEWIKMRCCRRGASRHCQPAGVVEEAFAMRQAILLAAITLLVSPEMNVWCLY